MSVLIKGMEMPKNCKDCPFSDHEAWCLIPGDWRERYYCPHDVVSEFCPLVEVKNPHGDLVDKDKLMMSLADWWYSSFGEEETDEAKAIRKVLDTVEQSIGEMTVVEAEGRE